MVPDLLVESRGAPVARLAIDTKYKLYDGKRLDSSDIYQTFLYAYALGSHVGDSSPISLLLYPATSGESMMVHLKVQTLLAVTGAEIIGVGIPIPVALEELRSGAEGTVCAGLRSLIAEALDG